MLEELVLTENRLLARTTTWNENQQTLATMTAFKYQTVSITPFFLAHCIYLNLVLIFDWNINQFGSTMTSLAIQITPTQMVFCQGNAIYNYTLYPNSTIKLVKANNLTCGSTVLINNFEASLYFRIRNKILDLYNSNVSLTI